MSPKDLEKTCTPFSNAQRKRSSEDTSDLPDVNTASPTKKLRFILDGNPLTAFSTSTITGDSNHRLQLREDAPSLTAFPVSEASSQPRDLHLAGDVRTMEHAPQSLTGPDEQADQTPPPSPRPRPRALPENNCIVVAPWNPTIPALPARPSSSPLPDSSLTDVPELDEDLLATQIEEMSEPNENEEDPRLAQARKNVHLTRAAYKRADRAMETARTVDISNQGDVNMANIVKNALSRLRVAKEKLREIERGDGDKSIPVYKQVISDYERDGTGNVWCSGMTKFSMRNQCCSDCKILQILILTSMAS